MSVEVRFIGRIGNNLFQYALGRIIAEHLDVSLECRLHPLSYLSRLGNLESLGQGGTLLDWASRFEFAPMRIPRLPSSARIERYELFTKPLFWMGHRLDLNKILADRHRRGIVLTGFFQRYEYYASRRRDIVPWFSSKASNDLPAISSNDVLINIRAGPDYQRLRWKIGPQYYLDAVDSLSSVGRVYVCGVGIGDDFKQKLARLRPTYVSGDPVAHLNCFKKFRKIVLSNSSFSWWGAFLSDADELIAPAVTGSAYGFHSERLGIDLRMADRNYREVPSGL